MRIYKFIALCFFVFYAYTGWGQTADFTASTTSGCAPVIVIFTSTSTGTDASTIYEWDLGNGSTPTGTGSGFASVGGTYLQPGSYTVVLTIRNGASSDTKTLTNLIMVYGAPEVDFNGSPLSGCSPLIVKFTDNSKATSGTISSWSWDFGDGNLGSGQDVSHPYNASGTFDVKLTVKNSFNCSFTLQKPAYVTVSDPIKADFSFTPPQNCTLPVTVKFNNASTGTGINSYAWDFGDAGTFTGPGSPSHTYTAGGTYDVKLVIKSSSGCTDSLIVKGAINIGNLKADFNIPASVCLGKPVYIANASSPIADLTGSLWDLDDAITSIEKDPTVTYGTVGIKIIKLTASFGSCKVTATKQITVVDAPIPSFTFTPKGACIPPLRVQFTNTTTGGTVVKWMLSDGQTSTLANPLLTLNVFGNYNVTLIVKNPSGCMDTLTKPKAIYIGPPKINAIAGLPYAGCAPWSNLFSLDVTASENIVKYQWDFGDGATSNLASPTHNYPDTGLFLVSATITTSSGCTDTFIDTVRLTLPPKADFIATPLLVCPKDEVNFTDLSTGIITSWHWTFGDGGTSDSKDPIYKYNDTGWMQVTLAVYNEGCGDTIISEIKYLYVNPPVSKFIDSFSCNNQKARFFRDRSAFRDDPLGLKYWEWRIDNSPPIISQDLDFVFADTGSYSVELYVKDEYCEHTSTKQILVLDEEPDFTFLDTGTCVTTKLEFTAGGPKCHPWNIKRYLWYFGDGGGASTDTPYAVHTYLFKDQKDVQVTLQIIDLNNCVKTITKTITVRSFGPKANFSPYPISACSGSKLFFNDSSTFIPSIPIKSWIWDFGDGPPVTFTKPPFFKTYTNAGVYEIKLTVIDSLGCTDSIKIPNAVTIYKPKANFLAEDTLVCVNADVKFVNLSKGTKLQNSWDFGNSTFSNITNPIIKYGIPGIYDIKLVVVDTIGCTDSITKPKYIKVADALASFNVSDSFTSCPPLVVSFINTSSGYITSDWDFGNGNSSDLISPSHTYLTPGIFIAKLKVTGNGGCYAEASKIITIQGPSGNITYDPLLGCPPVTVTFNSTAINTKIYTWDFVDGVVTITQNPTIKHTYQVPGDYVPKLILDDGLGCSVSFQGKDTIRIFGARAYIRQLPKVSFCDSTTVSFFDSTVANDMVVFYKWSFGDGTTAFEQNPVHSYSKPGVYTVIFEVRTASGCTSIDTLKTPVVIAATPQLSLSPIIAACVPADVVYKATWVNADTSTINWKWDFGNSQTSTLFSPPVLQYSRPGNYTIKLIAKNLYGCADTVSGIFTVNDTPKVAVGPPSYICKSQPITLTATGAATYQWDANPTLSCFNCQSPIATPSIWQVYRAVGTDANGCKSSDTVLIKVKDPGNLRVQLGDTICVGKSYQLQASGSEFYRWSPSTGLSSTTAANPLARPTATTTYMVIGTDSLNCFPDTGYAVIVVYPIPTFEIGQETITAPTGSIILLNTSSSADINYWRWTPPIGLSCINCPQPTLTVTQPITYIAKVSNQGGCTSQDLVTVIPTCSSENIFIPNTFSPNGDGNNDVFFPHGKGLAAIKNMRIFNRWGELIYQRKDFAVNDPSVGWDGSYSGKKLTPDVYVYLMDVLCENNEVFSVKGNITLLK